MTYFECHEILGRVLENKHKIVISDYYLVGLIQIAVSFTTKDVLIWMVHKNDEKAITILEKKAVGAFYNVLGINPSNNFFPASMKDCNLSIKKNVFYLLFLPLIRSIVREERVHKVMSKKQTSLGKTWMLSQVNIL